MQALQFGLSLLVWGVFVRTVLVWHITWSVNSVTHMWGYRNYETDEIEPQQSGSSGISATAKAGTTTTTPTRAPHGTAICGGRST